MQASPQPQRGMPAGNMAQIMALAKKMSDSQLAEVLSGKNMDVPQFVAMTEAMGRKQLRTAMEGAQAMGAGKQPSEKEKLMAELQPQPQMQAPPQGQMPPQAGVAAVPAPNMENVGMAGGGIVAFNGEDGSDVTERSLSPSQQAAEEWAQRLAQMTAPSTGGAPKNPNEMSGLEAFGRTVLPASFFAPSRAPAVNDNAYSDPMGNVAYGAGPHIPTTASGVPVSVLKDAKANVMPDQQAGLASLANAPTAKTTSTGTGKTGGAGAAGLKAAAEATQPEAKKIDAASRKNYLDELTPNKDETAKQAESIKNQGQGEFLMQLGAALMSTPNLGVALSKGAQAGLPGLAANRKEINALTKDQRDYNLNFAKAQEARQQGNEEMALKYEQLAEQAKFHAGTIAYQNRMADAYMARATAGGGGAGSAKLTSQQHTTALTQANGAWDKYVKTLPPSAARKITPEQREEFIQKAYQSNIGYITGNPPQIQTGPQLFDTLPTGAQIRE